jgi:multiple sugar transport system substrate-binding protein
MMFVNTSLLSELGLKGPQPGWTWDDFYELSQQVADRGKSRGLFAVTRFSWRALAFADGWTPCTADGSRAFFDDPGFFQTVGFLAKIYRLDDNRTVPEFDSGRVAFAPDRFSHYRAYQFYPYRIKWFQFGWSAIEMPSAPHHGQASELPTLLLGLSGRTAHPAEAWKLLKLLTADPDTQVDILKHSSGWPASALALQDSRVESLLKGDAHGTEGAIDARVIDSIVEHAAIPPRFKTYGQVMEVADRELYRILDEPFNLESRLQKLNLSMNHLLKN